MPDVHERIANLSPAKRALLEAHLMQRGAVGTAIDTIPRRQSTAPCALSFAQQRLWFLAQMDPESPLYNEPKALRLHGALHVDLLQQALAAVVERHEALCTTFMTINGTPMQVIAEKPEVALPIVDLRTWPEPTRAVEVQRQLTAAMQRPFDLRRDVLLRALLVRVEDQAYVLLLVTHHIASDGWSTGILFREIDAFYTAFAAGAPVTLAALPIQYADYALWQRQWLQGERLHTQLAYWKQQLAGAPTLLELPTDHPRPVLQSWHGTRQSCLFPASLTADLKRLSQQHGVTLFMTLLAAFQTLLYRYTGQDDIVVGAPIAGRSRKETEDLIGFFVNALALRTRFADHPTFQQLLGQVREVTLGAYAHQELPFEKLVEELQPERSLSYAPLVQVHFAFQNVPRSRLTLPDVSVLEFDIERTVAKFDMTLFMWETEGTLRAAWEYNTDLFEADTIARMAGHFQTLLAGLVVSPAMPITQLPLLAEAERHQLLVAWNATQTDYPHDTCLHQLFEAQVARTPAAIAVIFADEQRTYRELNQRANQLAHYLRRLGVGPEVRVGIGLERSLDLVVALLGVLKAGGAYVPLDPDYPQERLAFMVEDAQVAVLLTQQHCQTRFPVSPVRRLCLDTAWEAIACEPDTLPDSGVSAGNLAYVLYTSGSTGQPKGVMIPHQALCNHMWWMQTTFPLTASDRVLQKTPVSFDASVWEFYAPLLAGAQLVMAPPGSHQDAQALLNVVAASHITTLQLVPSMLRLLLEMEQPERAHSLQRVFCGGERLSVELQTQCFAQWGAALYNLYGPTEATIDATWWPCAAQGEAYTVPIGRPIANMEAYVLDACLQPTPIGVAGELYLGGVGLGRGYWQRPALTAAQYLPHPFSHEPGAKLYKTGDLARYRPDGSLEFLGRYDAQVKLRGFRIELGELEAVLRRHPAVREAVLLLREDTPGDQRLVAYLVVTASPPPTPNTLRSFLGQHVPAYMMPTAFVLLETMPLMPNGKVDRQALPPPDRQRPSGDNVLVAPRTPVEEVLVALWAEVLRLDQVGIHDNFFNLGGHSLLAVRLLERMRQAGLHADVRALFVSPTLADLAAAVGGDSDVVEVPPNRIPPVCDAITPAMLPLVQLTSGDIERITEAVPGGAANIQDIYPLAPLQEGILFHHLMATEGDPYVLSALVGFDSRARLQGYLHALQAVIDRHDILRTAVLWEGLPEPVQVVWRQAPLAVEEVTLAPTDGDVAQQLYALFGPQHSQFDVRQAPLIRVFIAPDAANARWVMLQLSHHLSSDHTTAEVMQQEIQAHVLGHAEQLLPPLPFRNFVAQARLGVSKEEHQAFFQQMLGDVDEPTTPFGLTNVHGDGADITTARRLVDPSLARRLRSRARALGVSAASVCHLAWAQVLARVSGRDDVVFGTLLFGRMQGGSGADRVLGLFINTLPVRLRVGEEGVQDRVRHTHVLLVQLLRHEHAPLTLTQRCSAVAAPTPLFSALFNYRYSTATSPARAEAMQAHEGIVSLGRTGRTTYPLTLAVDDGDEGFTLTAQVQLPIDPQRVCAYMHTALEQLVDALESVPTTPVRSLDILPAAERHQLLVEWNNTAADFPRDDCIHTLFEAQVECTPEAIAVVCGEEHLTYRAINRRANQLAHTLQALGVGPDILVGLCLERSVEMIVGQLGILKAGGAYVPLDPTYPQERLDFMLEDTQTPVLVTHTRLLPDLPRHQARLVCLDTLEGLSTATDEDNPHSSVTTEHLAYVLYTSGSTGTPKGVAVPHRAVQRLVCNTNYVQLTPADVVAQVANCAFDAATFEIWGALVHGARLIILPTEIILSPRAFATQLEQQGVSVLFLTTALFNQIAAVLPQAFQTLRAVLFGGEAVEPRWVAAVLKHGPPARLLHVYGPTETTTFASWYQVEHVAEGAATVPIGRPITNTQLYVLDASHQPVPVGVPGELYIGGDGVARGYLNRPALTAERFLPDPFRSVPDARLYKSGDLVRYQPDGALEFLGRLDSQVKLRGFRIELGEIETLIRQYPGVRDAVVLTRDDDPENKRLVAYVVCDSTSAPPPNVWRDFLQAKLPDYMIPVVFIRLDTLPLTANGKVDRLALPVPDRALWPSEDTFVAPRDLLETQITQVWEQVLDVRPIGIYDNFFALGGHSLLAVRLCMRLEQACRAVVPLALLFQAPTVAQLADRLHQGSVSASPMRLLPYRSDGAKPPLFWVHGVELLGHYLDNEQPFYMLHPYALDGRRAPNTIEAMAVAYLREIRLVQPEGPYFLGGGSVGGMIAFEMAQQLLQQGQDIAFLALLDPTAPRHVSKIRHSIPQKIKTAGRRIVTKVVEQYLQHGWQVPWRLRLPYFTEVSLQAAQIYTPQRYSGGLTLLQATQRSTDLEQEWGQFVAGPLDSYTVPGDHFSMLQEPHVQVLAARLGLCLQQAQAMCHAGAWPASA